MAEITAEGQAKMKVKPDIVIFTLSVEKEDTIEKNAIRLLNEEIQFLSQSLEKIGFPAKSIKISDYRVSTPGYNHDDQPKKYMASNTLKVEFWINNKLIDALYSEVQSKGFNDLDITYETKLSDSLERSVRTKLVQMAIEDAKANALNISKGLGLTIRKVKQVFKENPYSQLSLLTLSKFTPPKNSFAATDFSFKTPFDKFEVEETELEEKITIVYEVVN